MTEAETIYEAYPRKVAKREAIKKIQKAIKEVGFLELLKMTEAYARAVAGKEKQFIPHPATWFNQGRYEDSPEVEESKPGQPKIPEWEGVEHAPEWQLCNKEECIEFSRLLSLINAAHRFGLEYKGEILGPVPVPYIPDGVEPFLEAIDTGRPMLNDVYAKGRRFYEASLAGDDEALVKYYRACSDKLVETYVELRTVKTRYFGATVKEWE